MTGNGEADPMASVRSSSCCGARTRQAGRGGQVAMANGRCRFHGGLSTGPRTPEGQERSRLAGLRHGNHTADGRAFRQLLRALKADARRICEAVT